MSNIPQPVLVADPVPARILWPLVPGLLLAMLFLGVISLRWQPEKLPLEELRTILDNPNIGARSKALVAFQTRLRTDPETAIIPELATELLRRIDVLVTTSTAREEALFRRFPTLGAASRERELTILLGDRDYLHELIATLPYTIPPVGLPILRELAESKPDIDPVALAYRRRAALRALALLGEGVQRWQQIPPGDLNLVLDYLARAPGQGRVAQGHQEALQYLQSARAGHPDLLGLEKTLALCSTEKDPVLRENAAFCSRYWIGTAEQNAVIEGFLLKLLSDPGEGEELRTQLQIQPAQPDVKPGPRPVQAQPGFLVRSQATLALAWRGSEKVPLEGLNQLLDLDHLKAMLLVELPDGKRQPNEPQILDLLVGTLDSVVQHHKTLPGRDLAALLPALEKLISHPSTAIQQPAAIARAALLDRKIP